MVLIKPTVGLERRKSQVNHTLNGHVISERQQGPRLGNIFNNYGSNWLYCCLYVVSLAFSTAGLVYVWKSKGIKLIQNPLSNIFTIKKNKLIV